MKLRHLLEMPVLRKEELPPRTDSPFYSEETLAANHEFIHTGTTADGIKYWCVMRKDGHSAAIGTPGQRADGKWGMRILGTVEFKQLQLSGKLPIQLKSNVKHVGLVHIGVPTQRQGWGMRLYTALADAGYSVISDNTQYIGGQSLWKRIAAETMSGRYKVYVIKNGEIVTDSNGIPVEYNSHNIDDSDLWSENTDHKYTLFGLVKS